MATIQQIQQELAQLKTQDDLNRWFATSGHTAEQLAEAAPQFGGVADYQNAMQQGAQAYHAANPSSALTLDNPADPWGGNRGAASTYNQWADITPTTYQQYVGKMAAAKSDPTAAWLTSGASPLSEADWLAQNARVATSPHTWGGGDDAASAAAHAARVAALPQNTAQVAPTTGPLTVTTRPPTNPTGPVVQPGQVATGNAQYAPMNWGQPAAQSFNTPVLDALYSSQQQRMTSAAPNFNFQAKPGALTQAVEG